MQDYLKKYMKRFGNLSEEMLDQIVSEIVIKEFRKGTCLLEQGQIPKYDYFVLKGCVRAYTINEEGIENTLEFYTEEYTIASMAVVSDFTESPYTLECIEDCVLVVSEISKEEVMYDKYSGLERMVMKMVEENYSNLLKKNATFITDNVESRYLKLLEDRPDLFERVPQHQIASYLGITPESFSRMKKRIKQS